MINKQYRLAVFDWEGTLSDSLGLILHCIATEAKRLDYGVMDEVLARQMVEFGLVNALRKLFPHLHLDEMEKLLSAVQQSLLTRHGEVFLIPGALDLVSSLKEAGYLLAIASNKGPQSLQRAIAATGLDKYIALIRAAGPLPPKPDKTMLVEILNASALEPENAVMIGDSLADIEMAVSASVDVVGLDFHHSQKPLFQQAGALEVFDNFQEVKDFLLRRQERFPHENP